MAITDSIEKTREDIRKTLEGSAPIAALAGFGDLAVSKLRGARADITARAEKFDPKALRDQAQATLLSAPEQAKELPVKAQALLSDTVMTALTAYGELADRGQSLINRVRGQQATSDLEDQASATVTKVKAATTTVKKSAAATKQSATATRTTAKKSAAKTKTASKAAATSAKKSATAAKKAAADGAAKVGN